MFFNEKYFPSTRIHDDDEKKLFYTQLHDNDSSEAIICVPLNYIFVPYNLFSRQSNWGAKNPFSVAKSAAVVVRLRLSEAHKKTLHMSSVLP